MIKKIVVAALGVSMLFAAPTFAAANASSPPEPYTAPDPAPSQHAVKSDVTMPQPKDTVSLTDNGASSGSSHSSQ